MSPAFVRRPATMFDVTPDDADAVMPGHTAGGESTGTCMVTLLNVRRDNEKRLTAHAVSL